MAEGGAPSAAKIDSGSDAGAKADASDGSTTPPAATFSVGGTVSGLLGTGLVLQNNAGDDLPVGADGTFTFPKKLISGAAFAVSIKTQPSAPKQTCSVSGDSGTVAGGNVTSVVVNCAADKFTIGGTVTGLVGTGLILQNNAGPDLIINANGAFAFPVPVSSGAAYAVTVKTQPGTPSQTCTVTNGTGTVAATKITNVAIACTVNKFTVGGTVTGLAGAGLVLQVNGGDSLPIPASGPFSFATSIASGAAYAVTVSAQPTDPSQTCAVTGGTGTVGAANVTSVAVSCTTNKYTVGGTASGILGTAVLQNNGGNDLNVSANGTFAFSTPIESGAAYAVTIKTQPGTPSQTCSLTNQAGNVAGANVTTVALSCVTNTFKVKGTVNGLAGAGLVLQNKAGDDLAIGADGAFAFVTPVASGQTYAVTVKTQPTAPSQSCTVSSGNGTIGAADVADVVVNCVTNSYTVGGSVAGLAGTGLTLQNNGGDDLVIPAAGGAFTFATKVLSGGAYSVAVKTQPSNPTQTCTVNAGAGTVTNGNVVTVMINCTTNKYSVGGTASGLVGTGLVLTNNGGNDLTVNGNGSFAFSAPISSGATYSVAVKTQPTVPSQTCTVTGGAGTVGGANITTVNVACVTNKYSVGGSISGLGGGSITLQNNGTDNLVRNTDGTFTFATTIASGATYAVTVLSEPAGKFCTVTNGSGTIGSSNVANVIVTCSVGSCKSFDLNGFTCPSAATRYCSATPIVATDSAQAKAACEACYGAPCVVTFNDCAGGGFGPGPNYGQAHFGYQNGCSGAAGRIWPYGSSYTTFGRWAP